MKLFLKRFFVPLFIISMTSYFAFSAKIDVGSDRVVKVNNRIITVKELEKEFDQRLKLNIPNMDGSTVTKRSVLENMIDDELLKNDVRGKNLVVDENQVTSMLDNYKQMYMQAMTKDNPNFKFNEEEYKSYILKEVKISYEKFKEKIQDTVLVRQFIGKRAEKKLQDVAQKKYSDKFLMDFYDKNVAQFVVPKFVELKHIFIKAIGPDLKPNAEEKIIAKKKIDDIYSRIKKGESFDDLCEKFSEDPESRDRKNPKTNKIDRGYLGPLFKTDENAKQQFGEELIDELFVLQKGQYSKVLESKVGFHIFYCVDKKDQTIMPYEDAKQKLVDYFRMMDQDKIFKDEFTSVLKELRKKASIEYYKDEYK